MKPKTVSIQLDPDDMKTIQNFFDVLQDIGYYASDKRTIDIVGYLLENWCRMCKGDTVIYVDKIGEDLSTN